MATIGESGVPSQNTINYDDLLSTTLFNYSPTIRDNIFKDSAFLALMRMNGGIEHQDGGERAAIPLMYQSNSTVKTVGGYEQLDTTPQEGLTTAFYEWAEIGGTISIARGEERKNSGESKIINLLKAKVKQAEMTMREKINGDLVAGQVSSNTFIPDLSDGGSPGLFPLGYFFRKDNSTDPTTGGNVGNIAGADNSWWRHNTAVLDNGTKDTGNAFALSVTTYAGLLVALRRMYNYCSRGSGGSPDIVLTDQVTSETYENSLDTKVRYTNTQLGEIGFDNIKLRGATMIWDEVVPDVDNGYEAGNASATDGTAFFLNSEFYKLMVDSQTDIVTTPFVEPENQTAKVAKILFMAQACISNMRKHGVCYAISQSIVS